MTARPLVIVGGGEHARVVADAARAGGDAWELVGFTHRPDDRGDGGRLGLPDLGTDEALAAVLAARPDAERPWLVLGFGGSAAARRRAVATFGDAARWATVVHPAACVSPDARLGEGTVVLAGAVVNTGAVVGDHVIVNTRVVVEHDVEVGSRTHLAPGVVIGGGTRIGDDAMVGLGAAIRDHVSIGARAVVGMGAVVVADVPADTLVLGVPARDRGAAHGA